MRAAVPREGLAARLPWFPGGSLRDLARDVITIARDGLAARGLRDASGRDESLYLDPLETIARGGPTQAEHWLTRYHGEWDRDVRKIFAEAAI
ncbi:MAG: hypothetical protein JO227_09010 [Acetobacteraceae bacterium]|nr:hypothetical protein [Acetobacteraceae bacterium]